MPVELWKIEEEQRGTNSALAADAVEDIYTATLRVDQYNSLEINNNDANDIGIRLEGSLTDDYVIKGKKFWVLEPQEGKFFRAVRLHNRDAAAALTAASITFKAFKKVKING